MCAIGSSGLHRDGRGDVPLRAHLDTEALLVDVGHDEVDELAGVGVGAGRGVEEHVLAIEAAVPDEVLVGVVVTRQAELERGRAVEVAQVEGVDALALEVAFHHGVAGAGRDIDVAELRGLEHIGHVGHDVVTTVDGVCHAGLHAGIEEVVHLVPAEGIVGERAAPPETITPDLGKLALQAQIDVEVADEPIHLVPDTAIVAVGVVVVADDVAFFGHMVGVVEVGLAFIRLQVFSILINIVVVVAAKEVGNAFVIVRPRNIQGKAACHDEVGSELMLEIRGNAHLVFVVMTLGKDILGGFAGDGVAQCAIGVLHGEEVVAIGVVELVPVDLGNLRVAVHPGFNLGLDFRRAVGIGRVIARQVLVVVRTRVLGFTPFKAGLSARAAEVVDRGVELRLTSWVPVPVELHERLVVGAHARVADDLLARHAISLVAPVGVVVVGADEVVGLLHHWRRAATLRGSSEDGEVEAVLVVDLLLDGEEVAVGPIEGAFGVAVARIAAADVGHEVPAVAHLARADGAHDTVVVGTVAKGVAQRDLLAVLRGTGGVGRKATEAAEAGIGLAETFHEDGVTESVVEAAPVGEDRTSRLGVVHRDAVDHHLAIFRVVAADAVAQRAEVVSCNAVEHIARRVKQGGGVVGRGRGLLEVGIHQDYRRQVVLVQVGGVEDLGFEPRHHQQGNRQ